MYYVGWLAVPQREWIELFGHAKQEISILSYAALLVADTPEVVEVIKRKAREGVRVRVLLGHPAKEVDADQYFDYGIEHTETAFRTALRAYRTLGGMGNVEVRFHNLMLDTSIFRGDEGLLASPHIPGIPVEGSPVLRFVGPCGREITRTYIEGFESVWSRSRPEHLHE